MVAATLLQLLSLAGVVAAAAAARCPVLMSMFAHGYPHE